MTDKQIIIDGVDVSECEFAVKPINDNGIKCHCAKGLLQIAKMQEQPESIKSGLCENNPNCYYKQLKRKEQENKKLKEDEKSLLNIIDNLQKEKNKWVEKYNDLGQDFDQLKQTLSSIKNIAEEQAPYLNIGEAKTMIEIEYDYAGKICNLEQRMYKILQKISEVNNE